MFLDIKTFHQNREENVLQYLWKPWLAVCSISILKMLNVEEWVFY